MPQAERDDPSTHHHPTPGVVRLNDHTYYQVSSPSLLQAVSRLELRN